MLNKYHQFHMITMSPWPIISSIQLWNMMMQTTTSLLTKMSKMMLVNSFAISTTSYMWWKNTMKEASKEGYHQGMVMKGLKLGMLLFITSEVLFFMSFFWSYFHSSISPNAEIGQIWPPLSTKPFNPVNVPLLNTLILISSGVTITWAHHNIIGKKMVKSKMALLITCALGVYFSMLQAMEYLQAEFSMTDACYGTIFFMATGFHGLHVIIGTTFLITNLFMINNMLISHTHHIGFEMAAWYWHFVDVVWLFLYMSVYWWGK